MQVFRSSPDRLKVEIRDIKLQDLSPREAEEIRALVYEHKIVVFKDQQMSRVEYVALSRVLGTPQIYFQDNYHHPEHPEIFVSSNVLEDGKKIGVANTGAYWHTDYQFFDEPLPMTMLYPQIMSWGERKTWYIELDLAFETLPDDLKRYARGATARHEAKWRYKVQACDIDKSVTQILEEIGALTPPVTHPMVIRHPVNGRELLYISRGFTVGIEGEPYERGREILARLFEHMEDPARLVHHTYAIGDVILWDNRQLLHKAGDTIPGAQSMNYRIGIYDGLAFYRRPAEGARP